MNIKELKLILEEGEGYTIEFKENVNSDLSREFVAMANSSGGRVFLGISDANEIIGIDANNSLLSKIQDIAGHCDPAVDIRIEKFRNILIIHVKEGVNKPYRCTKGFYIRNGANTQKLTTREITEFIQAEGKVRFGELLSMDVNFEKIFDEELLDRYLGLAKVSKTMNNISILQNLGVLQVKNSNPILNNAGILFFAKDPTRYLLHASITCALYKGTEKITVLDRKDLSGNLIQNIEDSVIFLKKHLNLSYEITGLRRKEILEIPDVALRETVVNAVCHRDYFEQGANIMVEIFDDRVEISNPGGLPKALAPKYFGVRSIRRNPIIASLLHRAGYIEKMGTGINRIKQSLKKAGGPDPVFNFDSFFTVIFKRTQEKTVESEKTVEKTVEKILDSISANPSMTINKLVEETGLSRRGVEWNLDKLKKEGKLERIGPDKGGHWKVRT